MMMTGRKIIHAVGGLSLCSIAVIVFLVGVVAVIDPAGTKMADDGDPFGTPPSRLGSAVVCLEGIGLFIGGCLLMRTGNGTRSEAEPANPAYRR
jgi:hypothetical protein